MLNHPTVDRLRDHLTGGPVESRYAIIRASGRLRSELFQRDTRRQLLRFERLPPREVARLIDIP